MLQHRNVIIKHIYHLLRITLYGLIFHFVIYFCEVAKCHSTSEQYACTLLDVLYSLRSCLQSDSLCSFFYLPRITQIPLIFYHPDFTIFALLLRKKRSMDDTDSYSLRSLFFFRQNDRRTFFSLDIRLAMPVAYLGEKKTG